MEVELPDKMFDELREAAERVGLGSPTEAALIAIGEWVSRRKAELEDASQKYFVNEALDELAAKKK